METFFIIAWLIGAIAGGAFLLTSFYYFDRMLRKFYAETPQAWLNWGMPCGFFWVPAEAKKQLMRSSMMRSELYYAWLNRGPGAGEAIELARFRYFTFLGKTMFVLALGTLAAVVVCVVWPSR